MSTDSPVSSPKKSESTPGTRLRNFLIVMVGVVLSVVLLLGLRNQTETVSLTQLNQESTPLEVALSNGNPSLVEFYADWCSVCQRMAPEMAQLQQQYGSTVNFVMLNVDNNKWLPEMLHYRVDGIPHFVFLDKNGMAIAQTIGDQPASIMESNLEALKIGSPLPYAQASGKVSEFSASVAPGSNNDPRRHGSQVID